MDLHAILRDIATHARDDALVFPTSAELALQARRLLDDPDCPADKLARLVQADPMLATRVVAVANSAAYSRGGKPIADVRGAIARIGFATLRSLATSVVVRQMQGMAATPEHRQLAAQLWEHTAHVAALAQVIARRVTRVDGETALFAGVVHEVGSFYLIARAADFPGLLEMHPGDLIDWADGGAAEVGRAVLRRLEVPAMVMDAIEGLWRGYLAMPPTSLADTLLLADQLAPVESPLSTLAGFGHGDAEVSIDFALDERTLAEVLDESAGDVKSLIGALRA